MRDIMCSALQGDFFYRKSRCLLYFPHIWYFPTQKVMVPSLQLFIFFTFICHSLFAFCVLVMSVFIPPGSFYSVNLFFLFFLFTDSNNLWLGFICLGAFAVTLLRRISALQAAYPVFIEMSLLSLICHHESLYYNQTARRWHVWLCPSCKKHRVGGTGCH